MRNSIPLLYKICSFLYSTRNSFALLLFGMLSYHSLVAANTSDSLSYNTNPSNTTIEYKADLAFGVIGAAENENLDNPSDNVFIIDILEDIDVNAEYYLQYEVSGVQGKEAISRSVNERQSMGGYIIKASNEWT